MPQAQTQTKTSDTSSSASQVSYVPIKNLDKVWFHVEPLLQKPLEIDGNAYTPKDILDGLLNKKMQLWIAWKDEKIQAAIVTEIVDYPQLRACRWFLAGGTDIKDWIVPIQELVESWAQQNNVQRMEIVGRKGWGRWLKQYTNTHTVLMKEIQNE
jgi:hypothetical protein